MLIPDPDHLDEDLLGKIMVYADGDADETVTAEIETLMTARMKQSAGSSEQETLKRRIHLQILRPIKRPAVRTLWRYTQKTPHGDHRPRRFLGIHHVALSTLPRQGSCLRLTDTA